MVVRDQRGLGQTREKRGLGSERVVRDQRGVGYDKILMPEKETVHGQSMHGQEEVLSYGHREIKNPKPEDFAGRKQWLGSDHSALNSADHESALGLKPGALQALSAGPMSRPSMATHETQEFKEQIMEQQKDAKAAKKAKAEMKRNARPFKRSAHEATTKATLEDRYKKLLKKLRKDVGSMKQALLHGSDDEELAGLFKNSQDTLKLRVAMVERMVGNAEKSRDQNQQLWDTWTTSSEVTDAMRDFQEPYEHLALVKILPAISADIGALQLTGWATMKLEKERIGGLFQAASAALSHCNKQATRVNNLVNRKLRDRERAAIAEAAEMEKSAQQVCGNQQRAAVVAAAKAKATSAPRPGAGIKTCHALDNIPDCVPEIEVVTSPVSVVANSLAYATKPVIVNKELDLDGTLVTHTETVLQKFKGSHLFLTGRGSDPIPGSVKVPKSVMTVESGKLRQGLTGADTNFVDQPWIFCNSPDMCAAGPEYLTVCSAKYQITGTRRVLLIEFAGALKFLLASVGPGATLTLGRINDTLRNADKALLTALSKHAKMYKATVAEKTTLWIPWGFLLIEQAVNNTDIIGLRWTFVTDFLNENYIELAKVMLPDDVSEVRPNSTSALMGKLISAFQGMSGSPKIELKPIKQEAVTKLTAIRSVKRQLDDAQPAGNDGKRPNA